MSGPTFMEAEEIINKHKEATLDVRQGVVALARLVRELEERVLELERKIPHE